MAIEHPCPDFRDDLPAFLELDSGLLPRKDTAIVPGGGDVAVTVILFHPACRNKPFFPLIGKLSPVPIRDNTVCIEAFPVSPPAPSSVRRFYIVPQSDGSLILSDAGPSKSA